MFRRIKKFWPFLFLLAIFFILFYKVIFLGQVFYDGDNFHLNIPEKYFFVQQILQGHIPLWNPYLFLGIPYLADFNLGTLNPMNFVYFLFPIPRALTLLTIFDFLGLAVGMYFLLRSFLLSKVSSVFGAVVMSLSGMPFVLLGNMTFMQVIVYIPFLFLLVQKFCKEKKYKWLFILVIVQLLQLFAGHPQETYYTMLFISFYLLFFAPFPFMKRIFVIAVYILFPIILSGVQLLPFLEYVQHANRQVSSIDYSGWGGLNLSLLFTFLFPTFYGSHVDGTWWGAQQILVGFIGIPTIVIAYVGGRFGKWKEKWFYLFGAGITFLLAFGKLTPVFYIFYYLVPGWRLFRAPAGILVMTTFFASILAAYGIEYIRNHSEKLRVFGKVITVIGFLAIVFSGGIYVYANKIHFWRAVLLALKVHVHKHIIDSLLFYDSTKLQQMFQGILWNMLYASFFLFLTGILFTFFSKKKYQTFLFLLLTTVGFLIVNPKAILLSPINVYAVNSHVPTVLQPVLQGQYRILSIPVNLHQERQHLPPADFFSKEAQANLSMYQYDNNIERGLYQVAGYTSLVPESFAIFINAKDATTNVTNINFSNITQKQLNQSSVKYITSHEPIQDYNNISLKLVAAKQNSYFLYENASALRRAYLLSNPQAGDIVWKKIEPTLLSFSVHTEKEDKLIVTDWYYPGWRAFVNGKEVKIYPYKSTFQEISVLKGVSRIELIYDPWSFKLGAVITLISFVVWVLLLSISLKFPRKTWGA